MASSAEAAVAICYGKVEIQTPRERLAQLMPNVSERQEQREDTRTDRMQARRHIVAMKIDLTSQVFR